METSIAELVILAAVVWGLYRLLDPLRRRLERAILRWLGSPEADMIDVEPVQEKPSRRK